jgi:hypothetical protein
MSPGIEETGIVKLAMDEKRVRIRFEAVDAIVALVIETVKCEEL